MSLHLRTETTVYDRYAISRKFLAQQTEINIVQGKISLIASESQINELKNGNKTMYSRLATVEVNLNNITLAVSSSEYKTINGVLSAVTQARASITIHSEQILQKVSKDSIISSINQTPESVKINANKIALTGNGIIDILNTGTTTISASRINLNGVVTANQNFKILADGSMVAQNGTFSGSISGTAISGSSFRSESSRRGVMTISGAIINMETNYSGQGVKMSSISADGVVFYGNDSVSGSTLVQNSGFYCFYNSYVTGVSSHYGVNAIIEGNLIVYGEKNRAVTTEHFGDIVQSAYETTEPMFGDMGHNCTDECGECLIFIDPIFAETVSTEYGYYVFLTECSKGDVWVDKKQNTYFTVHGDSGVEFDWEIKVHQKGYENSRLKKVEIESKADALRAGGIR